MCDKCREEGLSEAEIDEKKITGIRAASSFLELAVKGSDATVDQPDDPMQVFLNACDVEQLSTLESQLTYVARTAATAAMPVELEIAERVKDAQQTN